jgi:threonine synthase
MPWLRCICCGSRHDIGPLFQGCPTCAGAGAFGLLDPEYDDNAGGVTLETLTAGTGSIWSALPRLPLVDPAHVVTLGEGRTPLVRVARLAREIGCDALFLKLETMNPTWSHKDRYNTVVVSMARSFGIRRVLTYTTGNHGNSMAAYAAAAELDSAVFLHPETSDAQRSLGRVYGAEVVVGEKGAVEGTMARMIRERGWVPSASFTYSVDGRVEHFVNPFGTEGYKTIAYELAAAPEGAALDYVLAPVGYGDLLAGIWKGYTELHRLRLVDSLPRMVGCQSEAGDPLARAVKRGDAEVTAVPESPGVALSIIEGHCSDRVLGAVVESKGTAESVNDDEVDEAVRLLGRAGVCVEPSSAVPVAVLRRLLASGAVARTARVACVITSAGVKWPDHMRRMFGVGTTVRSGDDPVLRRLDGRTS